VIPEESSGDTDGRRPRDWQIKEGKEKAERGVATRIGDQGRPVNREAEGEKPSKPAVKKGMISKKKKKGTTINRGKQESGTVGAGGKGGKV